MTTLESIVIMHVFRWTMSLITLQTILRGCIFCVVLAMCSSSDVSAQSAAASSLTINVSLQSRTNAANQPFEITLVNSYGGVTQVAESDADGHLTLSGLTGGNYTLRFKHPQYLAVTLPVSLAPGANTLNIGPLKGGDANNDNLVSLADVSLIAMSYNRLAGEPGYDARADLNADQRISLLDFSVLTSNYGQTGAPALEIPQPSETRYPSQVIDLTNWKITLPFGDPATPNVPIEIKQPQLAIFSVNPWFQLSSDGSGIAFRAPVNGVTTSGSVYPRSELREMTDSGFLRASWSSMGGTHTMLIDEAITAIPTTKQQIVAAQIHDSSAAVILIRLDYPTLYINVNGKNVFTMDSNYVLGKRFNIKFVVSGGKSSVYYNSSSTPVYVLTKDYSGAYFKAGAYTQSNCSTEGNTALCNENNFGEVVIYQLAVQHQ
jgi:alginate lyase